AEEHQPEPQFVEPPERQEEPPRHCMAPALAVAHARPFQDQGFAHAGRESSSAWCRGPAKTGLPGIFGASMARILTGIQSTGILHLGNVLGAIRPAIAASTLPGNDSFLFIADLHSLTQIKDAANLRDNTYYVAATWLACGLDPERTVFYRQSDVPEVTELTWYLSCFFPYSRLSLAHSFKDKADRLEDV